MLNLSSNGRARATRPGQRPVDGGTGDRRASDARRRRRAARAALARVAAAQRRQRPHPDEEGTAGRYPPASPKTR
jgi:hypothetical protein